jgi:hypothetical protein
VDIHATLFGRRQHLANLRHRTRDRLSGQEQYEQRCMPGKKAHEPEVPALLSQVKPSAERVGSAWSSKLGRAHEE